MKPRPARHAIGACGAALAVALSCAAAVGLASCASARTYGDRPSDDYEEGARPLDPLTPAEQERAEAAARRHPQVIELVGEDARLGTVQFVVPSKPERESADQEPDLGRHAAVLLSAPARRTGAWVLVDLRATKVLEVRSIPSADVPLGHEDLEAAWELARGSREVASLVGAELAGYRVRGEREAVGSVGREVLGMPVRGTREDDPCSRNRCLALLFRQGRSFLRNAEVIVDLTAGTVRVNRREEPNE